jgi:HSP20 family protein
MFDLIPWKRRKRERAPATWPGEFRREFDDLVARFFGEGFGLTDQGWAGTFRPAIDVSETDDEIVIKAEVPGTEQKDLQVELTGDVLTIKGEKREEREKKDESHHRIERSFGSFTRSFALPCEVKEEAVEAVYKDGILTLKLPKCETAKKKSIKIKVD